MHKGLEPVLYILLPENFCLHLSYFPTKYMYIMYIRASSAGTFFYRYIH